MPYLRTMKFSIILIVVFIGLSACNKIVKKTDEITKVELATGSCFGTCQFTATSIDNEFHYKYFGGSFSFPLPGNKKPKDSYTGYYEGLINRSLWDTLILKLNKIHYKQLDTLYAHSVDDQSLEVIIYYQNKIKHIKAQSASLPDSVLEAFNWIANSYKSIKLKPAKDTLHFETQTQNEFALYKIPKNLRFMPPLKKR